jgi:hypothetical protein
MTETETETETDAATDGSETAATVRGIMAVLLGAVVAGAAVSISLGVYAKTHDPTGDTIVMFGFPRMLPMKAWFATGAAALALAQIATALWMWGRLPGVSRPAPAWAVHGHRWFGTLAFLLTLPVAYHCLWALGFQDTTARVAAHSLLGTAFFGVFTTKMLVLRSDRVPARTVPIVGGLLATILVAIWWTSSFWFFTNVGFPM